MYKQSVSHTNRHAGLTEEGQPFLKDKVPLSVHTCSSHCVPFPHTPVSWLTDSLHGSQNVTPPQATRASTEGNGLTQLLIVDKALCDLAPRLQGSQHSEAWQQKNSCRICLCQQLSVRINSGRLQKLYRWMIFSPNLAHMVSWLFSWSWSNLYIHGPFAQL